MRKIYIAVFFSSLFFTALSQNYSINIQAGGNTSIIPKFDNTVTYTRMLTNPWDVLSTESGNIHSAYTQETLPKNQIAFFADAQLERKLRNGWSLSASLGVNQVKYTYDNESMKQDVHKEYGDTKLTYLTSRIANISKRWNRFSITAGPELNYLLSKKYYNQFTQRSTVENKMYIETYSDGRGDAQKLLIGATLAARYEIAKKFYISLGGQKLLNSLYKKEGTADDVHKKSRPLQVELGIGYRLINF